MKTIEIDGVKYVPETTDAGKRVGPYTIGESMMIRTVTMFQVGRLIEVHEHELVLVDAAWAADTGRFSTALATGELPEVEPWPDGDRVIIGRGAIVDACTWRHDLPRKAKP
jgi:hypothetical protein